MNAGRQFNITVKAKEKSTEKLSSGYRINRASDDAAGLSISEKLRRQIRGLTQGVKNTEEGVSLCQVADGALSEVDDMLHRMNELAVKSANGTNTDTDREYIQQEVEALKSEIDRIGSTTTFNEKLIFDGKLASYNPTLDYLYETEDEENAAILNQYLQGSYPVVSSNVTLSDGQVISAEAANNILGMMSCFSLTYALKSDKIIYDSGYSVGQISDPSKVKQYWHQINSIIKGMSPYASNKTRFLSKMNEADSYVDNFVDTKRDKNNQMSWAYSAANSAAGYPNSSTQNLKNGAIERAITACDDIMSSINTTAGYLLDAQHEFFLASFYILKSEGINSGEIYDAVGWRNPDAACKSACDIYREFFGSKVKPADSEIESLTKRGLWIQSGAEAEQGMYISIDAMNTNELNLSRADVSTASGAENTISLVSAALQKVNGIRSDIGAQQNRLEHTIDNEENVVENTTASESQIRDADMATEAAASARLEILRQAGISIMSQANQSNQGVLQLLQ